MPEHTPLHRLISSHKNRTKSVSGKDETFGNISGIKRPKQQVANTQKKKKQSKGGKDFDFNTFFRTLMGGR